MVEAHRIESSGRRAPERLPRGFFDRPVLEVAPDLLDTVLWHDSAAGLVAVRLVEVEAYDGPGDPASHSFRGQTARNAVMFGPPGHAYVYFTYGMHFCVNVVCGPAGQPSAVLIRAGQVIAGADLAARRRGRRAENGSRLREVDLARGPARLCQALGIDRGLDGVDLCSDDVRDTGPGTPLGIGPPGAIGPDGTSSAAVITAAHVTAASEQICTGPRVGVSRAVDWPWRYWLAGDGHVSPYRPSKPRVRRPRPVTGRSAEGGTMQP
ncbi:MAG TPA: DNA-3-methyladenine glycosylase [Streptosporangiaceae bacterium]